jgi:hypothetical protein
MSSIADIVDVEITRETQTVSQAGFGTVLILGAHKVFNERIRFYLSSDAILEDGFTVQDPEYVAANAAFSQTPRPVQVAIGRRSADVVNLQVGQVVALTDYRVTINGTDFVYQAQVGNTAADIAEELVDLINAGSEPVTAAALTLGAFSLTADVVNEAYSVSTSARVSLVKPIVASDDITNDLIAISQENDDWYGLVITSRSTADVIEAATYIESRVKIFGTASDDLAILDATSESDIAYILKEGNFKRTFILYHNLAGVAYPEAAWFGRQFPVAPGSSTWAFKTLEGIPTVRMTQTQRTNVFNKNANTYESRGGASITREGKMSGNEWIDVVRGLDWLEARMTERIFQRLVNSPKIPYTDAGVAIIEAEIRAQLDIAIEQGVIALDPAYVVTSPRVRNVNPNDKANRILPDINFTATLSGAIQTVTVRGRVSL